MDRRAFISTLAGGLLAAPLVAEGQQHDKTMRIGLLDYAASNPASDARWSAFRERLRELGYAERQNVAFELRRADGQASRLPSLAAKLVNAKVNILVTASSEATLAAKQATSSIPIVMATGIDPVALGLVASLARPAGNITGVTSVSSDLAGKRLELLKQLIPKASRIALLHDPNNRATVGLARDTESSGKSMGVVVLLFDVRRPGDLEGAFLAIKHARVDAVIFGENTVFLAERGRIANLAITHRLPMMANAGEYSQAGALLSYATDYLELFRQAAIYVDKILKGAKPADLPVERPTKFDLVINLKTAKALGLKIPPSLLQRADQIIE